MKNDLLMVSHVLNGTGHLTFYEFSPLPPVPNSFLDELRFCALAVVSIFALCGCSLLALLRGLSLYLCSFAVFCSVCHSHSLLAGCMRSFECARTEDAARFSDSLTEHYNLMIDSVVYSQNTTKELNI